MIQDDVVLQFKKIMNSAPMFLIRAPGRVNLIGEHTDYNDGFVLPMAIDKAIWIALRPRIDEKIRVFSLDFNEEAGFDLADIRKNDPQWLEYVKGTAWILQQEGYKVSGWEGVLAGDIPIGGGLSSSAAMELASARAFSSVANWEWSPKEMAKLCQRAENEWIGMKCGIMDQMICAVGKINHAMLLDCRSLETRLVSLPLNINIVIMDTATRRELVDSAYNERRRQCQAAANYFGVPALRDVDEDVFEKKKSGLDEITRRRAKHIITENKRTLDAADALENNDPEKMGELMKASHASLRDDFEVSRTEVDEIVEIASSQSGCYGARMTGAGFGGCAVALVNKKDTGDFVKTVDREYRRITKLIPSLYVCSATNGAEIV